MLLAAGANPNQLVPAQRIDNVQLPLLCFVLDDPIMVRLLLDAGAAPDQVCEFRLPFSEPFLDQAARFGSSPLFWAVWTINLMYNKPARGRVVVQDHAARPGVQPVQHLRHGPHAAVGFPAELAQGLQLLADHGGDLHDDLRRDLVQAGHALGDIRAHLRRQRNQQRRRLRRVQVGEHQRDGLRVFVVNELRQLLGVGFLNRVEGSRLRPQRLGQAVQHPFGDIRSERAQQQLPGEIDAAARDVIAREGQLMELLEHALRLVGGNGRDSGHLAADGLHVFFPELLQQVRTGLFAQGRSAAGPPYARLEAIPTWWR